MQWNPEELVVDIGINPRSDGDGIDIFPHFMIAGAMADNAQREELEYCVNENAEIEL